LRVVLDSELAPAGTARQPRWSCRTLYPVAHARFRDILWYVAFENCIGCGGALHENDVRAG